jgi:hypothetical protein
MPKTYTYLPQDIPSIIGNIVEQLSVNLATQLGHSVDFLHGTWHSIEGRIIDKSTGTVTKDSTFPLICLIQVFEERFKADTEYSDVTLTLLFCNISEPSWYSEDRYANNYLPTLYPMYAEFMQLLNESPYFVGYNVLYPEHTKVDDLHLPEDNTNKLPACLDGLWVRDLKLRVDNKCLPVENWVSTELVLGTITYNDPTIDIQTRIVFDTLDGFKNDSLFRVFYTADNGSAVSAVVASGQGYEYLSRVGNTLTFKVTDVTLLTKTIVYTSTIPYVAGQPPEVLVTGKVSSMSNLRPLWVNKNNIQDSITT